MNRLKSKRLHIVLLLVILCLFFLQMGGQAWAATYCLGGTENECYETVIASGKPDINLGLGVETPVGFYSHGDWQKMRGLYYFDITTLTANSERTVVTAKLRLFLVFSTGNDPCTITVHRLNTSWTETGATWIKTDGVNYWSTPGGTWDGATVATTSVGPLTGEVGRWVEWDVKNLVQYWLDNPTQNYGLLLKSLTEGGSDLYRVFCSSNSTSATAAFWPQLIVTTESTAGINDDTPPTTPVVTDEGTYTTSRDTLRAVATSTDTQSGISGYSYAVGTRQGGQDIVPRTDVSTSTTRLQINVTTTLALGQKYYFSVASRNSAGLTSNQGVSDGITVDWTPPTLPTTPTVTAVGTTTGSGTELHASWTANDFESQIAECQYSIGTSPGLTNVVGWTSAGTNKSVTCTGLNLQSNQTYYFNVKAKNQAGLWSSVRSSDGIMVKISYTFYFPWYDCQGMKTWILVGNPQKSSANVTISVGGTQMSSVSIPAGGRQYFFYTGTMGGPVKVVSDQAIFTTQRSLYPVGAPASFWEVPGISDRKLTKTYYFPWYDCQSMATWVLVGNASTTSTAYIDLFVGGSQRENDYPIVPGGRAYFKYDGLMDGPVKVVSTNGSGGVGPSVYATQRSIYQSSFCEVVGIAANQLTTTYYFPWYDCRNMKTWILIANPDTVNYASVEIWVGPERRQVILIKPGSRYYAYYDRVMNGPVKIVSRTGPIYATQRSIYGSSFCEVVGIPSNQLTNTYYFPWYDCRNMKTWILVGNPSDAVRANVNIYIAGQWKEAFSLGPKGRYYAYYSGLIEGPVKVVSDNQVFTTQRSLFGPSFCEVVGIKLN